MNPKEKFKQEQNFLETSPDETLDGIKEKINLDDLKEWQVGEIVGILDRDDVNSVVGKISEIFDLNEKELEHLRKLPVDIIKKIFVKQEKQEDEE